MAAWKEAETLKLSGAQTGEGPLTAGSTATTISVAGITTLTYFAVDNAGNQETPKTLTVRIDKTPPIMSCSVNPAQLWPPDHKLAPVSVTVGLTDSLSGPAGFTLRSVTSSEP